MKILHLCLSCFYIDDAGYQENYLVRQHVRDGHEVLVIASTETFDGRGGLTYTEPKTYTGSDGARVIRIPYSKWLPRRLAKKLRIHPGVYDLVAKFKPDVILFHGSSGNEIVSVARYARDHPNVLFYTDSHADSNNSAQNFMSRNILHRLFYRFRLHQALPQIKKVLCVSIEAMDFLSEAYGVPDEMLEFFPLGGEVLRKEEIQEKRAVTRAALEASEDTFIFIQTGKMAKRKRLASSLRAFALLPGDNLRFWIVGLLGDEIRDEVVALIDADPRVVFLGWKSPEELTDLLCAADAYVQPGSQSATMQNALCCGCPVILDDVPAHQPYRAAGAVLVDGEQALLEALAEATHWDSSEKQAQALAFAGKHLDYGKLAQRVLQI